MLSWIVIIVGIIVVGYLAYREFSSWEDTVAGAFFGMIIGGFCALLIFVLVNTFGYYNFVENETMKMVSLERESTVNGSFVLGCGSLEGKQYYFGYVVSPDGSYMLETFPVEETKLHEKPISIAVVHKYVAKYKSNYFTFFPPIGGTHYEIDVPEGTIINRYVP